MNVYLRGLESSIGFGVRGLSEGLHNGPILYWVSRNVQVYRVM